MANGTFCGPDGALAFDLSQAALDDRCFVRGLLLPAPYGVCLLGLACCGVRAFCRALTHRKADRFNIQVNEAEEGPVEEEDCPPSLGTEVLIHLTWLSCFLVTAVVLLEAAEVITVETFEWYQLTSVLSRLLGLICCMWLYAIAGTTMSRIPLLGVNLLVWLLSAAGGLAWLRQVVNSGRFSLVLAVATPTAYTGLCAALALWTAGLILRHSCPARYATLPTDDSDVDPSLDVPLNPMVALSLKDPQLRFAPDGANFLSRITYLWFAPLLVEAWRAPLQMGQLGRLPLRDSAHEGLKGLHHRWHAQTAVQQRDASRASLLFPLCQQHAVPLVVAYACLQVADLLAFVGPLALKGIVQYVTDKQSGTFIVPETATLSAIASNGWVLAIALLVVPVVQAMVNQMFEFLSGRLSVNVEAGLQALIYHKALTLNMELLPAGVTAGSLNSHMSVDTSSVSVLFILIFYCFTVPVQLALTVYLLYVNIGWAGPASLLVVLLITPIQSALGHLSIGAQEAVLRHNDARLKLLNELLQGIRIVKFYAWEPIFLGRISAKRDEQLHSLTLRKMWWTGTTVLSLSTPSLITVAGFALYTWLSATPLTPGVAFSVLALFNMLRLPMVILPMAINCWINAAVSAKRLIKFLLLPTMDRSFHHATPHTTSVKISGEFKWALPGVEAADPPKAGEEAKEAVNGAATNGRSSEKPVGQEGRIEKFVFDFEAPRGSLVMVVGLVGSGKSTLIKSILGDVPCLS
eukprot:EG_transcript_4500